MDILSHYLVDYLRVWDGLTSLHVIFSQLGTIKGCIGKVYSSAKTYFVFMTRFKPQWTELAQILQKRVDEPNPGAPLKYNSFSVKWHYFIDLVQGN